MNAKTPAGSPSATVSCPCGATIPVNPTAGDDVVFCPDCRETLQLTVSVDPVTKRKRVGVVLSMGALLSQKGKKGQTNVPGAAADVVHKAKCVCGAQVLVDPGGVDSVHVCGKCGAGYTAVLKRGKTPGLSTLVLRPVQAAPVSTKIVPPAKPAPPAKPRPVPAPARKPVSPKLDAAATPAREQVLTIHRGDIGAQGIQVREDGSFVACFCGKDLKLRDEANREMHKCASCGVSYRIFYAFDPRTTSPMVVMLPRSSK